MSLPMQFAVALGLIISAIQFAYGCHMLVGWLVGL